MDLKSVLSGKTAKDSQHYWALVIEPRWVQAGIWTINEGKAEVASISPPVAWKSDEELAASSDTALSVAVQNLPEEAGEPSKAVFGVPFSWVSEGQIKEKYLEKIKTICSKLSLTPVGFVVLSEAISHLMKSEEGSPLSAVVLGIGKDDIEVSVFKLGNLAGTSVVARSVSVANDVVEGLTRFSAGETLPSRFLLYNGKEGELEKARQSLMEADWKGFEKLKLLHPPKMEVVTSENKILATALAGGSEIASVSSVEKAFVDEDKEEGEEEKTDEKKKLDLDSQPEAVGFVVGKDVAADSGRTPPVEKEEKKPVVEEEKRSAADKPVEGTVIPTPPKKKKRLSFNNSPFSSIFRRTKMKLRSISKKEPKEEEAQGRKLFVVAGLFFPLLLIGGFAYWWFVPKATVTIYVSPKALEEKISIYVDPATGSLDTGTKTLPGEVIGDEVSGDKTRSTTGTRTVGERAKGEVTLYRSGSEMELSSGTSLVGSSELGFTLDEDVIIASGSAGSPGTSKASVTADDIGDQYNLASGEVFQISNYPTSDVEAKSEDAFSGGSSRDINAVSEEDQTELEEELKEELLDQAIQDIKDSLSSDQFLIEESVESTTSDRSFSDKVGDEASTLKLSLSLDVSGLVVDKASLFELSQEVFRDKVASGFVLREDQVDISFEFGGEEDGIYELKAVIKANLLPEVKPEEIARKIAGRYPLLAKDFLTSIDGFARAKINIKPKFPGRLGTLPRVHKNITIEIAAER